MRPWLSRPTGHLAGHLPVVPPAADGTVSRARMAAAMVLTGTVVALSGCGAASAEPAGGDRGITSASPAPAAAATSEEETSAVTTAAGEDPGEVGPPAAFAMPAVCDLPAAVWVDGSHPDSVPNTDGASAGGASVVSLLEGDVDGDGASDWLVGTSCDYGGNAQYTATYVFDHDGDLLGRLPVEVNVISSREVVAEVVGVEADGTILVSAFGFLPEDYDCCPGLEQSVSFQWDGNAFRAVSGPLVGWVDPAGAADPGSVSGQGNDFTGAVGYVAEYESVRALREDAVAAGFDCELMSVGGAGGAGEVGQCGADRLMVVWTSEADRQAARGRETDEYVEGSLRLEGGNWTISGPAQMVLPLAPVMGGVLERVRVYSG